MPCEAYIDAHFTAGGVFADYSLHCGGQCEPSNKECKHHTRRTAEGDKVIHETWCGCENEEPTGCHLVLRQVFKQGNPKPIEECVRCVGTCRNIDDTADSACLLFVTPYFPVEEEARIAPDDWKGFEQISTGDCEKLNVPREVWFRYECGCSLF